MRTSALLIAASVCLTLTACDGGDAKKEAKPSAQDNAAAEKAARVEAKRKEREAKAKAKEDEAAAKKAAVEALLVLPETMPKKLDKACAAAGEAQDAFMNRHFDGEAAEKWNAAKTTQIQMTVTNCKKAGSIEVAACQKQAMDAAPEDMKKSLPDLLRGCIEKYGKPPEGVTPPA